MIKKIIEHLKFIDETFHKNIYLKKTLSGFPQTLRSQLDECEKSFLEKHLSPYPMSSIFFQKHSESLKEYSTKTTSLKKTKSKNEVDLKIQPMITHMQTRLATVNHSSNNLELAILSEILPILSNKVSYSKPEAIDINEVLKNASINFLIKSLPDVMGISEIQLLLNRLERLLAKQLSAQTNLIEEYNTNLHETTPEILFIRHILNEKSRAPLQLQLEGLKILCSHLKDNLIDTPLSIVSKHLEELFATFAQSEETKEAIDPRILDQTITDSSNFKKNHHQKVTTQSYLKNDLLMQQLLSYITELSELSEKINKSINSQSTKMQSIKMTETISITPRTLEKEQQYFSRRNQHKYLTQSLCLSLLKEYINPNEISSEQAELGLVLCALILKNRPRWFELSIAKVLLCIISLGVWYSRQSSKIDDSFENSIKNTMYFFKAKLSKQSVQPRVDSGSQSVFARV